MTEQGLTTTWLSAAEVTAINVVLDGLPSVHSRRAYQRALSDFFRWLRAQQTTAQERPALGKALVQAYTASLRAAGLSAASINQRLSAIRKLAIEAADNGWLDPQLASGIRAVKGARQEGRRAGNWLTRDEAQTWLNAPDANTVKGLRDRALLSVLIGCGLRRAEAAGLTFNHIQQRDGRWVLVDLIGKRDRVRSVPMPAWAKHAIDAWGDVASSHAAESVKAGYIFRPVNKSDRVAGARMTPQAIRNIVCQYAANLGNSGVAPHDLRRTFAKLAHKGGSGLDQIQLSLGHHSILTTERYLGVEQDLTDAPCDHLGLRLG